MGFVIVVKKNKLDADIYQTEFAIITVMANLVIDGWLCTIYIPKTSRRLVGWINILDLSDL